MRTVFSNLVWAVFSGVLATTLALDIPCTEKLVGGSCLFDADCFGEHTICKNGQCRCPTNFEEFDLNEKNKVCRPAPNKLGAACQRDCKPPLLCRDGKCECYGGEMINGRCTIKCPSDQRLIGAECRKVRGLNQRCEATADCATPLTVCRSGRCRCDAGTRHDRGGCLAMCPDGSAPRQTCKRLFVNEADLLDNAPETLDSCGKGYYCVAGQAPYVGHCCPLRCPYGSPDLSHSCDAGQSTKSRCQPLTHYCFRTSEPGFGTAVCCPRPCREPNPLFVNGACVTMAHRGDECRFDGQCEGGLAMECAADKRCRCRSGYVQVEARFASCHKECALGQVQVQGKCQGKVPMNGRCHSSAQCPNGARCYYGTCQCKCGYELKRLFGLPPQCSNPDDPFTIGGITDAFGKIFANKGGIRLPSL